MECLGFKSIKNMESLYSFFVLMFWVTLLKVTSSFVAVSLQYGQRTPRQDAASTAAPKDSEYLTAKVIHPHILRVCRQK